MILGDRAGDRTFGLAGHLNCGRYGNVYTCYTFFRDRKAQAPTKTELEEVQPLNGTEADEDENTISQSQSRIRAFLNKESRMYDV